jgi:hypothetical protein
VPAYAVISVAAGDNIVAVDPVSLSVLFVAHVRLGRRQLVQLDVVRFVDGLSACCIAGRIKVFGKRGLAICHHRLIEYRWADGEYSRLPGLAAHLVRRGVAVLVATGGEPSHHLAHR